jgi:tryptophan-rich sensory protein
MPCSIKPMLLQVMLCAALALVMSPMLATAFHPSTTSPLSRLEKGAIPPQPHHGMSPLDNSDKLRPFQLAMMSDSVGGSISSSDDDDTSSTTTTRVDTGAMARYAAAFVLQMGLFTGLFHGLDALVAASPLQKVPFALNCLFFYACALKSRILNPLNNQRPQAKTKELKSEEKPRQMPSWTPPGFVFPIVWLLIIGPIRAVSSSLVYQSSGGRYATKALLTLMAHLSIGDIWNTINNKERRYGTSVVGVLMVWLSAAAAAHRYHQVSPLAGRLLSLPLIWLTVASSLIVRTWQLNPNAGTGRPEPLIPTTDAETTITKLEWFES